MSVAGDEAAGAGFRGRDRQRLLPADVDQRPRGCEQSWSGMPSHHRSSGSRTVAVAIAAMPSPRPVKPSFSLVVALTATRSIGDAGDRRRCARAWRRDAGRCAAPRRRSVTSRWAMRPPRARTRSTAKARKRSERRAVPLRIARREMHADVAVGERAEDRVGQRMQHHVGIGMAGERRASCGNAHAAEHDVVAVGRRDARR